MGLRHKLAGGALAATVALVAAHEGYRAYTYADPVGIPTACFGHTGPNVRMGQTYTRLQCEKLLIDDLQKAHNAVVQCIRTPLTDNQRVALTSFAYNVGGQALCGSTLAKKANAGDMAGACNELPRWVYAKGIKLPGLIRRRAEERALCLTT